jgi:hypothetical protein
VRAANALANFDKSNSFLTRLKTVLDVVRIFEEAFKGTGKLDKTVLDVVRIFEEAFKGTGKLDNMNGYL